MFFGRTAARMCATGDTSAVMNDTFLPASHLLHRKAGAVSASPAASQPGRSIPANGKVIFRSCLRVSQGKVMKTISGIIARGLLVLALVASVTPVTQMAQASPTELFFSEYIEGTSNNKALEIYNGTGAAVDLATGGYKIQMHFNGNPVAGLTINLTGAVADG